MNKQNRAELLAESLREATRKAEQERADKLQVERIAKDVQARIAAAAENAKLPHRIHAEAGDLQCPQCGYTAPEDSFDEVDESDSYSTDDETSETGGDDSELDAAGKSRVVAELLARKRRC